MIKRNLFLNLFYDVYNNSFKLRTNIKRDWVNQKLWDCYKATLNQPSDRNNFNGIDFYVIKIKITEKRDINYFSIYSNTGNKVLAYGLIKKAMNNWERITEDLKFDKKTLDKVITRLKFN